MSLVAAPQGLILVYLYVFLAVYSVHPTWKYKWGWDNPVGRWALRLQGHGWATVSGSTAVLVRIRGRRPADAPGDIARLRAPRRYATHLTRYVSRSKGSR